MSGPQRIFRLGAGALTVIFLAVLLVACRAQPEPISRQTDTGPVAWVWSGAVTPSSASVVAHLNAPADNVRLVASPNADLSAPVYSDAVAADASTDNTVRLDVSGLTADTDYYYAVEIDGALDTTQQGVFHTFPEGPASFRFVFTNGADTGSNMPVFDAVREEKPLFYMNIGDLYYADIKDNDIDRFRDNYFQVLTAPRQQALYHAVPTVFMWDDHDYGPNNTDGGSPSRETSRLAYQEMVPHYPLQDDPSDHPECDYAEPEACRTINQSFAVGRAYFILSDLRSERTSKIRRDNADKSMMGAVQKQWLKEQLLYARDNYDLIFWISSVPWIQKKTLWSDRWGGYATEREELANFIRDNDIENLIILAGDAHMVALDDGTNSDYATGGGAAMPVMHGGSMNRKGSIKGGPYSHGAFENPKPEDGQYAVVEVTDTGGDEICVQYQGKRLPEGSAELTTLIDWETCFR